MNWLWSKLGYKKNTKNTKEEAPFDVIEREEATEVYPEVHAIVEAAVQAIINNEIQDKESHIASEFVDSRTEQEQSTVENSEEPSVNQELTSQQEKSNITSQQESSYNQNEIVSQEQNTQEQSILEVREYYRNLVLDKKNTIEYVKKHPNDLFKNVDSDYCFCDECTNNIKLIQMILRNNTMTKDDFVKLSNFGVKFNWKKLNKEFETYNSSLH